MQVLGLAGLPHRAVVEQAAGRNDGIGGSLGKALVDSANHTWVDLVAGLIWRCAVVKLREYADRALIVRLRDIG